ncbi:MAG: vitamin B12-dependent ribonucleotide reductase [Euryarchaeota archaeon]|nr:vitamin B12-dependent ribonucleotide reductase [Euryarchaeota archaeon]
MAIKKIRKRDGRVEDFNPEKIRNAILKAFIATGEGNGEVAGEIAREVVARVEERFPRAIPGVEDVQDIVEETLIKRGYARVAKAYILYRKEREQIRAAKSFIGVRDDLKLSVNATQVLQKRYLLKNDRGEVIETPAQMFRRVARAIARVEKRYGGDVAKAEERFYSAMVRLDFLPNSPTLMNAGTRLGQLSACFVLPVEDSLDSIFDALKHMALVQQSGGGTGFSFSKLRPRGDIVRSTKGVASGPVSFIRIFDVTTDVIKQGGKRRGANMGILRVDHPDIIEFITAKQQEGVLENFNLSVGVTDAFMEAVRRDEEYPLVNPRNGEVVRHVRARDVFDMIVTAAWRTGDPGLVFLDEVNRHNPTPELGEIESTNPCGEVPLLPYESCNLGSINLSHFVAKGEVDWERLREAVRLGVHFLDNVIDANRYPLKAIERMTRGNRKIGLGVMGFAEMLIMLGLRYDSNEAISFAEKLMGFIQREAKQASRELAEQRGSFPNIDKSIYAGEAMRNATVTTIAPTGTISIIAGTSSGIEPLFAISFIRNVMEGTKLLEVNPLFERIARERGFYSTSLMMKIAKSGSIQDIEEVPRDVRELFVTALDIAPEWHVRMQAAFQKHVDNAVSKTINLPHDASLEDVRRAFMLAYELKCKGITVYRYGSKREQVLYIGPIFKKETGEEHISADAEYSGGCPTRECIV